MIPENWMKPLPNSPLIVAFSGGPDSVFLTEFLQKHGYSNLILAHFNHHMHGRAGQNNIDEQFCKKYSQEKNLPLEKGDWETPCNSEEKARNARYAFLEQIRKQHNADWIAVAHHQDDQAETVFLQFLRSGGLKSLTGMREYNTERNIWRPILSYSKSEILESLRHHNIAYCIDKSNTESVFTRNWIRNDIFPLLKTRFPNLEKHLAQQATHFQKTEDEITALAEQFLKEYSFCDGVPCDVFLAQTHEVQVELLRKILKYKPLSSPFLREFFTLINNPHGGKKLETKYQVFEKRGGVITVKDI